MIKPRYYQQDAIDSIFKYFASNSGNPIVAMPTGCHAKGHGILMYDGSVKSVEDVTLGDQLMGPDSKPRTVLALARGRQEMRKITPKKGEPFIVNLDHKLSVKKVNEGGTHASAKSRIETITVRQYENGSNWYRHLRKLRRTGVEFNHKKLSIDPYFLGLMLGDGSLSQNLVKYTGSEPELLNFIKDYSKKQGLNVSVAYNKLNDKIFQLTLKDPLANRSRPNRLTDKFSSLGLDRTNSHTVFIPHQYISCSRQQRLQLLAGLIDSDGHYDKSGIYEVVTVSKMLAKDIVFLARSLGVAAYSSESNATLYGKVVSKKYRITLSGEMSCIPVRLEYKRAKKRRQIKDVLCTSFTTEELPIDDYYGFTLSDDKLYLDENFVVHHNTGKSVVIGGFINTVFEKFNDQKILVLTHVKELIEQNHEKLLVMNPTAPAGIYSAGVGRKEPGAPIVFGGIQSIVNKHELLGKVDLILIDECHLVSPKSSTSYQKLFDNLREVNPNIKVIGLTATPYRLGQGKLIDDGLFTDICYDLTTPKAFNRLIAEGYLSTLVPRATTTVIDTSDVAIRGGEFIESQLQAATDKDEITYAALQEAIKSGQDRKHWLIFGTGINHCKTIQKMLSYEGYPCAIVHSNLTKEERKEQIEGFKSGKYRALVNNNVLTTGFDFSAIDMIVVLRATNSPGLWVQILGRGTRPVYAEGYDLSDTEQRLLARKASGKPNCLVLDFPRNTARLGPINDPVLPKKRGSKGGGTAPVRLCDTEKGGCGTYLHASIRKCPHCGFEFPVQTKFGITAGTDELIVSDEPVVETFNVARVTYQIHKKKGKPDALKIGYFCGLRKFTNYICLEHGGYAAKKARDFWRKASDAKFVPSRTEQALSLTDSLRIPISLNVWINKKHPEILDIVYEEA